jgi:glycerate kinase
VSLRILIAPSGLKESVEPLDAVRLIKSGILRVFPAAVIDGVPIVDGGEGTTKTLVELTNGTLIETTVTGPVGDAVDSYIGILGTDPETAVIEMAAAAGLKLVPRDKRDPQRTTTYGVGELISLALDHGAKKILFGCGDSGTNDAGIGMAQALGVKFLDDNNANLGFGGVELPKLHRIDMSGLDPRLADVQIDAALNAKNILCGPNGVVRVYGPQKGATPAQVEQMAKALDHFAEVVNRDVGKDVALIDGGGASGGLGAGLHAFLGANLYARFDIIMQYLGLEELLPEANLIITAEGGIDFQTPQGKVPALLAERAREYNIPVVVLAGMLGKGVNDNYDAGITAFESIQTGPISLENAIEKGPYLLEDAAERLMRVIKVGMQLDLAGGHS